MWGRVDVSLLGSCFYYSLIRLFCQLCAMSNTEKQQAGRGDVEDDDEPDEWYGCVARANVTSFC